MLEGLLLALAGGGLGLLLARASNAALGRVGLPLTTAVSWPLELVLAPSLDLRVLCFALAAAVLSAIVFALLPAVEATRSDLAAMLRDLGAAAATRGSHGLRETVVAVQVAVSVVLLAAAGVALRNLLDTTRVDAGFDPEGAAVVTLSPDLLGYRMDDAEGLFSRVRQRVSELPGVSSAALASHLPLTAAINFGTFGPKVAIRAPERCLSTSLASGQGISRPCASRSLPAARSRRATARLHPTSSSSTKPWHIACGRIRRCSAAT